MCLLRQYSIYCGLYDVEDRNQGIWTVVIAETATDSARHMPRDRVTSLLALVLTNVGTMEPTGWRGS